MPTPTGYCSVEDVKNIFKLASDIIRVGPDTDGADNITEAGVGDNIYDVERRIDARISFKYPVPLDVPVDNVVKQIVENQTAYDIYIVAAASRSELVPEVVKQWKAQAQDLLKDIIDGRISLTVLPAEGAGKRATTSHLKKAREVEVTLADFDDWSAIGYEFIIKESFIVQKTEDDDLPRYKLNTDFEVLWKEGLMRRVRGSSIAKNQKIYCYFSYLETREYQRGLRRERPFVDEGYI